MKQPAKPHLLPFAPAEADIQKCAYYLWQQAGCPAGRDLELWLSAKELVRHHVAAGGPPAPAAGPGRPPRRRVA